MTARTLRLQQVRAEAQRALSAFGVRSSADIDLDAMAASSGSEVIYAPLDGATARVLQIGGRARICISTRIEDAGGRRFVLGHELGHVWLRHVIPDGTAKPLEQVCHPLRSERTSREREASVFAAELLMPESLVTPYCTGPVTLAHVHAIVRDFRTSLLASAMRLVELSPECCAIAYCSLGRVRWMKRSHTFADWIPKGRPLDPRTAAADYFRRGAIDDAVRVLPGDAWLPKDQIQGARIMVTEHAISVPELGAAFSLLSIPRDHIEVLRSPPLASAA
jgi:hypothetical protein